MQIRKVPVQGQLGEHRGVAAVRSKEEAPKLSVCSKLPGQQGPVGRAALRSSFANNVRCDRYHGGASCMTWL